MTSILLRRAEWLGVLLAGGLAMGGCAAENTTAAGTAIPPAPTSASLASVPAPLPPAPPAAPLPQPSSAPIVSAPSLNPQGAELAEGDEHRAQHHGGVLMLIALSLKDLDLSADQRAAADKIRVDLLAKTEPARAAGNDLANVLADGVAAGSVDRAKADAAIHKLVVQVQGQNDAVLLALDHLHAALNASQRAALVDGVSAHWERWKEAHGHDDQTDSQHHSGYLMALVKELRLTKDEAEKIKSAFHDRMKDKPQDSSHKEVQDHIKALVVAFKGETFSAKSLPGSNAAGAHMAQWGATRAARFFEAAAPVLSPDQRAKLAQSIRDRASRTPS